MNARIIFLPLALFLDVWSAVAQPGPDMSQWPDGRPGADFNITDEQGQKQGRWIRVYPNGKLYYSGSFRDNRPVGHFTFFRQTGTVLSEVQHEEGTDRVRAILYREDGSTSHQGNYETVFLDGEWTQWKTGLWKAFDKAGRIRLEEHYDQDTLNGIQRTFHPSGQLLEEGTYSMGKKTGKWLTYNREGLPLSEEHWRNGERHGPALVMDKGKPLSQGEYREGQPTGTWTTFNPDGKVRSLVEYEGGQPASETPQNGEFSAQYPSGRPEWLGRYAHGRLDGPFTAWHDLGEWVMVPADEGARSPAGQPGAGQSGGQDAMRRELRNQPMMEMGEYTAGVKDGTWRYFDENGDVLRTERWSLGRLQSTDH